jgi:hypothetical protein
MAMEVYKVAGIGVHKSMLAVVIADAAEIGEFRFERRKFGAGTAELKQLEEWFDEQVVRNWRTHSRLPRRLRLCSGAS